MSATVTEACLLRATPYGESDLVVVLFTRRFGRVSALARGARRSRRRFGGALDYFHGLEVELRQGRTGMGRLLGVELLEPRPRLASDMEAYWAGTHLLELIRLGAKEHDPDEPLFDLLESGLRALESGAHCRSLVRVFQVRLLSVLGYALALEECQACGGALGHLGIARSGCSLRCLRCAGPEAVPFSAGALQTLRTAGKLPGDRLASLRLTGAVEGELGPLLEAALTAALGHRPRTLETLP